MKEIKLRKKDIKPILEVTYPDYRGRKFSLTFQEHYYMSDYWYGGSRTYVKALKLENGQIKISSPEAEAQNPYNSKAHTAFDIPKNVALVEHTYFCGQDIGINIIVHPDSSLLPKLLPQN